MTGQVSKFPQIREAAGLISQIKKSQDLEILFGEVPKIQKLLTEILSKSNPSTETDNAMLISFSLFDALLDKQWISKEEWKSNYQTTLELGRTLILKKTSAEEKEEALDFLEQISAKVSRN